MKRWRGARTLAWRLGRFLYRWARYEGRNAPSINGEYWLIDLVVRMSNRQPAVLIDVGANKGEWSDAAAKALKRHGKNGEVHAIEPVDSTFRHLAERFSNEPVVVPHRVALSNRSGEADIHIAKPLGGTNSLHSGAGTAVERVRLQSLDEFVEGNGFRHIAMVKSDTEGHDFTVLEGGRRTLQAGRIDLWQFEYNHRWLYNKASLLAVFEFIEPLPYRLGKLYGDGIEIYERWHFELDRFFETNYVLVRRGCAFESLTDTAQFAACNAVIRGRPGQPGLSCEYRRCAESNQAGRQTCNE